MTDRGNVYIVDDETIIRRSLVLLLGEAGYQCRPFAGGADFIEALDYLAPGCVLLDIHMPALDGYSVQDALLRLRPEMPVIFMTAAGSIPAAVKVIKKGAVDYLEKPFSDERLLELVENAQAQLEEMVQAVGRNADAMRRVGRLTNRETEVLRTLLVGGDNKSVARALDLSARTVEMHRANIMRKMEVRSFAAAVQVAVEAGLSALPELSLRA
jgi:two-component system, LuxR family, response regulator FixJ